MPILILPVLSGILAWASFPTMNQGYLAWAALLPLVLYMIRVKTAGRAFLGGWVVGTVQFLGLLYWVPQVLSHYGGLPVYGAWGLFTILAATLGCFPAAACALTRHCMNRGGSRFLFVFPPAWVALEYLRGLIPFGGFPWLLFGYSQIDFPSLVQIADLVGVYGVSFLIVWVNAALAWFLFGVERGWRRSAPLAVGGLLLAVCLVYGSAALNRWNQIQPQHRAALLQSNLTIDHPQEMLSRKYRQGYLEMADRLPSNGIDLLVLPESPSPLFYHQDGDYRETMKGLARRFPLGLIFNNVRFREVAGVPVYFNSAFFLDGNGKELGIYDKMHLVPFGEYIPWPKIFFFSETISKDVGNFHPGEDHLTVPLAGHPANVLICFEAIFPDLSRVFVRKGSELIINLTNDAWYGDTSAPYQHLAMTRWRAVESRRYLLRAANSGISAIIAPSGKIEMKTGLLREDTAVGGFSFLREVTFYVRYGWFFPILCVVISLLVLFRSRMRKAKPAEIHQ